MEIGNTLKLEVIHVVNNDIWDTRKLTRGMINGLLSTDINIKLCHSIIDVLNGYW